MDDGSGSTAIARHDRYGVPDARLRLAVQIGPCHVEAVNAGRQGNACLCQSGPDVRCDLDCVGVVVATARNCSDVGPASTEEIYGLLQEQDIFVFPTSFEGTPVSILECISNAVVPIVTDLPGGIRDIVTDALGYRVALNDLEAFKNKISLLNENRELLKQMQRNAFELAQSSYNINNNADNYIKMFFEYSKFKREEKNTHVKLSRLDKPYIPNALIKVIRKLLR